MVSKRDQRIVVVGRHVSFWNAKWVGEETLCTTFNRLFLNSNKKIEILWRWDLLWRRLLFTWEQPLVQQIIDFIGDRCPTKNGNDGWMWCSNVEKKYVVKQVYGELINIEGGEDVFVGQDKLKKEQITRIHTRVVRTRKSKGLDGCLTKERRTR